MIKEITMPAGGQTTDTSVVGAWLVKKGDKVHRGTELLTVETDKATLTVESFAKGTVLALLAEEGDAVAAGTVIALIGDESDKPEAELRITGEGTLVKHEAQKTDTAQGINAGPAPSYEEDEYQPIHKAKPVRSTALENNVAQQDIKAMPNAKKLAGEYGVLLSDVAKYAGKNTLTRNDVQSYMENVPEISGQKDVGDVGTEVTYAEVPFTAMRRTIAKRMTESAQSIPVFRAAIEVNMENCISFRNKVNDNKDGRKISYNDILFKCVDAAVRKFPYINASCTDHAILLHQDVNIGLAVSVDAGLVVPVVDKVNEKNIMQISEVNKANITKAREGKLKPEDMSGGTITLSNLGMYPVTQFDAIINPPEACILAVGAMQNKPLLEDGEWNMIPVMCITGSFDHRIVDGAYGAGFLTELKKLIEDPVMALL